MSRRTAAKAKFRGLAKRSGHAHETKENRMNHIGVVVDTLWERGFRVEDPAALTLEHVALYVSIRLAMGIAPRSLHNEISAIRRVLTMSGRRAFAKSAEMRSKALGVPSGSRIGTNIAITDGEYEHLLARAEVIDPGTACAIRLERTIGLRGKEAVMSAPSLPQWVEALELGHAIHVTRGTKGGRLRHVFVPNIGAALAAVRTAMAFCHVNGGQLYPGKSLEQALRRYGHVMGVRLRTKGHGLRYAFAKERFLLYVAQGIVEDKALVLLARDLGHGDKRGAWARNVYLRHVLPPSKRGVPMSTEGSM